MGYPMTYQRVVRRAGLDQGDYLDISTVPWGALGMSPKEEAIAAAPEHVAVQLENLRLSVSNLLGDLRRLERDARDEGYICQEIVRQTGFSPDVVARVLFLFFEV